jgi:hypothetical protein
MPNFLDEEGNNNFYKEAFPCPVFHHGKRDAYLLQYTPCFGIRIGL